MNLTQNYVSNIASTPPLDTLCIAAGSHVWFKEILLSIGVGYRVAWSYWTFTKKGPLGRQLLGRPLLSLIPLLKCPLHPQWNAGCFEAWVFRCFCSGRGRVGIATQFSLLTGANPGTGDDNLSPLIEAFFKGVVESLACFRSNFVVEVPSDKDLPQMKVIEDVVYKV